MNQSESQRLLELLADQATQSLNNSEQAELAKLLAAQTDISEHELEYAAAAATLALVDKQESLPDDVRQKVLDQAAFYGPHQDNVTPFKRKPVRLKSLLSAWVLAAAMFVVAMIGWQSEPIEQAIEPTAAQKLAVLLQTQDVTRIDFGATEDPYAAGAGGEVVWNNRLQEGYMRISGLHANDPTVDQYQLWIFDKTRDDRYPVDGGVFDISPQGEVVIPITARLAVAEPALFAITVEPPGGVVVSSRERIVLAAALN